MFKRMLSMPEETFSLLSCSCGLNFVRSNKPSASWDCPSCVEGDPGNIGWVRDVPGPARDKVGVAEFNTLCWPAQRIMPGERR